MSYTSDDELKSHDAVGNDEVDNDEVGNDEVDQRLHQVARGPCAFRR